MNSSTTTFLQNLVVNNQAPSHGGLTTGYGPTVFINNTIANNDSTGGAYSDNAAVSLGGGTFVNNVLLGVPGKSAVVCSASSLGNFSHNLVYAPSGTAYATGCPDQTGIKGNLAGDPLLNNVTQGLAALRAGSPAIDAGDGTVASIPATDLGGGTRVVDGNGDGTATIDIGAYEFDPAYPVAQLAGVPTAFLTSNSLTLTVSGTGVVSYRYALDGGAFSGDTAVATPITLTGLSNGRHFIVVLGKNGSGLEQKAETATAAGWVVNTETSDLTFTSGGDVSWFVQPDVTRDGIAWQSGAVTSGQSSWLETTVTGPGALRFWWRIDSGYYDGSLSLTIDGTITTTWSNTTFNNTTGWRPQSVLVPAGSHTLRWTFTPQSYTVPWESAFLDQVSFQAGANPDVSAPTTTAAPGAGMYSTPQSVALSCSDGAGAGCAATLYCLGSGCTPTIPYTTPLSIASDTYLSFSSSDTAGNYEQVNTGHYTFDHTPPSTSSSLGGGTYSGERDVALYCGDSGLGCATTYYCTGSGCTPTTTYSTAIPITASTDLRYYSVDRGGNAEAVKTLSFTIIPDVTPPVTTTGSSSGTYQSLSVSLWCSDGSGSGCAHTYYCLGTGCTPTNLYTSYVNISRSNDLRFYSVDKSGNAEAVQTVSYVIDADPPTTTPSVASGIFTAPQTVTLSCSDGGGTGCSATYYCLGKGCTPHTAYSGPIAISESTYLTYYSSDRVGNWERDKTERYTIRSGPPATINVPAGQATIQGAIDAAQDGDTIVVAPGTYRENIDFKGKAISVTSSDGAAATIIDGGHAGSVVSFVSGEMRTSVLDGFTLRNGTSSNNLGYGGGVYVAQSAPAILNNRITGNTAYAGAGVGIYQGSPLLQGNLITNNSMGSSSYYYGGGGILLDGGADARIIGNTISNNTVSYGSGGGILVSDSFGATIRNNTVRNNSCGQNGGGVAIEDSDNVSVLQNVVAGNRAVAGGGVYLLQEFQVGAQLTLEGNTIALNEAPSGAGILASGPNDGTLIANTIVTSQNDQTPVQCEQGWYSDALPPAFQDNLVYALGGATFGGTCSGQNGVNGNLSADPLLNGPSFGYFSLTAGSPAIDAGDASVAGVPDFDLAGAPRLIAGTAGTAGGAARLDIGAYEFDPGEPRAVLSGAPTSAVRENSATITVAGDGIVSYRYAVDGGGFGPDAIPVATPITLTGLSGGAHVVAVIGKTSDREQRSASATVAGWTIDSLPPTTTATPGSGTNYSTAQSVTLACSDDPGGSGCVGTFYCLGGGCTPNLPYTAPIALSGDIGLKYYSVDAFGNQEAVKTASYSFVGSISGRVTDSATGSGISGVWVQLVNANTGSPAQSAPTDATGAYLLSGVRSGSYKVSFRANGYLNQWYNGRSDSSTATPVVITAPAAVTGIDAALNIAGRISGTVTSADTGAAIYGIYVTAHDAVTGAWGGSATTDGSGNYTMSGMATGRYKVRFWADYGYLGQWYGNKPDSASATEIVVSAGSTASGVNAALQKGGSVSGTITAGTGGAITSATVTVYDADSGSYVTSTGTDSSGRYSISGLSGRFKIEAFASGYLAQWYGGTSQAAASVVAVVPGGAVTGIDVALARGGSITGKITDRATGAGIPYASATAYDASTGQYVGSAGAGADGTYTIPGLASGSYQVSYSASGYIGQWSGGAGNQTSAATVAVTAPNTTSGVNAALLVGASITGTVTDKGTGTGLAWISVIAVDVATSNWGRSTYTDSSGNYTISGLPNGNYRIRFSGTDYTAQWYNAKAGYGTADVVAAAAGVPVSGIDAALEKGGAVSGTVTDAATGLPISGVSVQLMTASGSSVGYGWTDSFGRYRVSGVVSGSYRISFDRSGYLQFSTSVAVTAPAETTLDATLAGGGAISGTVTDRSTGVGLLAHVFSVDTRTGNSTGAVDTAADGSFTIAGLASGNYRLQVISTNNYLGGVFDGVGVGGGCPATIAVSAPATTSGVDVRLGQGGNISGRVIDGVTLRGIGNASVYVASTSQSLYGLGGFTAADGTYFITGVPSGEYFVSANQNGYLPGPQVRVTVAAATTATAADLSLQPGGGVTTGNGTISGHVTDSRTGEPVPGVVVEARNAGSGSSVRYSYSDSYGAFSIGGLPSGSYQLYYYLPGSYPGPTIDGTTTSTTTSTTGGTGYLGSSSATLGSVSTVGNVSLVSAAQQRASSGLANGVPATSPKRLTASPDMPTTTATSSAGTLAPIGPVTVTSPQETSGVDFTVDTLGAITGTVTDPSGAVIPYVTVLVYDSTTGAIVGTTQTESDGTYFRFGLPTGSYRVKFETDYPNLTVGGYQTRWYATAGSVGASDVGVVAGQVNSGIDAQMVPGGAITGAVSLPASLCTEWTTVSVTAYDADDKVVAQTFVTPQNAEQFTLWGLAAGSYKLFFAPPNPGLLRQWYRNANDAETATAVAVTPGASADGNDVTLVAGGATISGTVTGDTGCSLTIGNVRLFDWYSGGLVAEAAPLFGGHYQISGVPDGNYRLRFTVNGVDHWYKSSAETGTATRITVSGGTDVSGIDRTEACGPDGTLGDTGVPTLLDAIKVLRIAVGLDAATPEALVHCDVAPVVGGVAAPDGKIDITDALLILQKAARQTVLLP
ncbi:carboxypeptidase regulatory-like domain-containing protein [Geomesophilobacter sediminis]|uniref:Carboxypeptidase regulatory-like domain-containing protein n=1 Tax=Geomesophilobacter sediminis TaxID=2798584 RepID=A0A8J7IYQ7_9BACT|nr:carboxypeptidase regulatory-like domain-containing protein [Geomesophilobacter sediminis]MBJ6725342.1 carboxypeptidase regulatory-like domain-containing protein [Geomesophilobacter sediminis]